MAKKYLFPRFLVDTQEYQQAEAFWRSVCARVLGNHGKSDRSSPRWVENPSQSSDGNPIYGMVNREEQKGVRIIQQDPKEHRKWEIVSWMDTVGDEYYDSVQIKELVFTCNLTPEHADIFERLFEFWIEPTTTAERMKAKITELIGY